MTVTLTHGKADRRPAPRPGRPCSSIPAQRRMGYSARTSALWRLPVAQAERLTTGRIGFYDLETYAGALAAGSSLSRSDLRAAFYLVLCQLETGEGDRPRSGNVPRQSNVACAQRRLPSRVATTTHGARSAVDSRQAYSTSVSASLTAYNCRALNTLQSLRLRCPDHGKVLSFQLRLDSLRAWVARHLPLEFTTLVFRSTPAMFSHGRRDHHRSPLALALQRPPPHPRTTRHFLPTQAAHYFQWLSALDPSCVYPRVTLAGLIPWRIGRAVLGSPHPVSPPFLRPLRPCSCPTHPSSTCAQRVIRDRTRIFTLGGSAQDEGRSRRLAGVDEGRPGQCAVGALFALWCQASSRRKGECERDEGGRDEADENRAPTDRAAGWEKLGGEDRAPAARAPCTPPKVQGVHEASRLPECAAPGPLRGTCARRGQCAHTRRTALSSAPGTYGRLSWDDGASDAWAQSPDDGFSRNPYVLATGTALWEPSAAVNEQYTVLKLFYSSMLSTFWAVGPDTTRRLHGGRPPHRRRERDTWAPKMTTTVGSDPRILSRIPPPRRHCTPSFRHSSLVSYVAPPAAPAASAQTLARGAGRIDLCESILRAGHEGGPSTAAARATTVPGSASSVKHHIPRRYPIRRPPLYLTQRASHLVDTYRPRVSGYLGARMGHICPSPSNAIAAPHSPSGRRSTGRRLLRVDGVCVSPRSCNSRRDRAGSVCGESAGDLLLPRLLHLHTVSSGYGGGDTYLNGSDSSASSLTQVVATEDSGSRLHLPLAIFFLPPRAIPLHPSRFPMNAHFASRARFPNGDIVGIPRADLRIKPDSQRGFALAFDVGGLCTRVFAGNYDVYSHGISHFITTRILQGAQLLKFRPPFLRSPFSLSVFGSCAQDCREGDHGAVEDVSGGLGQKK
ncbi:hypothetical protein C8R47DRAFT_1067651 [Mycena vitilis]|nr:hypothetical protein C8R47DRAFT_1067651 [Mycena vitilis]